MDEFVSENQFRLQDGAEGKLDTLILRIDDDVIAVQPFEAAAKTLAPVEGRGEFDLGLMALPAGEIADPRERTIDPGRGDFDLVISLDGVLGFDEIEQRVRKLGAPFHIHAAIRPLGHDLQRLVLSAHDA